jgi:hypothetical protein
MARVSLEDPEVTLRDGNASVKLEVRMDSGAPGPPKGRVTLSVLGKGTVTSA